MDKGEASKANPSLVNGKTGNYVKKKNNQSQKKGISKEQNKKESENKRDSNASGNFNKPKIYQRQENRHRKKKTGNEGFHGARAPNQSTSNEGNKRRESEQDDSQKNEKKLLWQDVMKLKKEGLFPLKKKSSRFPKAKFFCRLCEYHCDNVEISKKHVKEPRHLGAKELKLLEKSLSALAMPLENQCEAITDLLEKVIAQNMLTKEEMNLRYKMKNDLEKHLKKIVAGASLEVTGSVLSRFALKSSDLNLDVLVPETEKASAGLLAIKKIFETPKHKFQCVASDFFSSYPTIHAQQLENETCIEIVVGVSCPAARNTNRLLGHYNELDARVQKLVVAFKYWAKLCQISNQHLGSLPSHCFPLMVVHFLQQVNPPVLPALHELHEDENPESYKTPDQLTPKWVSENTSSIGKLWVQLFRFYAVDFKMSVNVINVRFSQPYDRKETKWGKKMVIEDPFQIKRNMTHTVSSSSVYDYIYSRFKTTYRYFAIPQMMFGMLFKSVKLNVNIKEMPLVTEDEEKEVDEEEEGACAEDETEDDRQLRELNEKLREVEITQEKKSEKNTEIETQEEVKEHVEEKLMDIKVEDVKESLPSVTMATALHLMKQMKKEMLCYTFKESNFTDGKKLPLFCTVCQSSGHVKIYCSEDELPPLVKLPVLGRNYIEYLSTMFFRLKNECAPNSYEIMNRDSIVNELQSYIEKYFPGAILKVFGSSANGFGFGHSDLDLCLTFQGRPTGEGIDHIQVIEELAERLKNFRECRHVLPITTAKVPIVKFVLRRTQLEADLSLYNTLALQNTKLLSTYTAIDHRVKVLGYTMKYFAKLCDIGDASRGSLSSYAYILMVIHFLQQCKPPVVPVLQALYDHNKPAPELIIDGWNAWFHDDLTNLHKIWKNYGKNCQRVGELWVNLLRYYTEVFNWQENVITIRQLEPLTKLEKLWTTRCIAIEDPFDHSHNLGGGLSRKMNAFILKSFIKARAIFGSGFDYPPYGYPNLETFLFDKRVLTDGSPPNDRGCRCCGRIGHLVRDCPRKQKKELPKENVNSHKNKAKTENAVPPPKKGAVPNSECRSDVSKVVPKDVTVSSTQKSDVNGGSKKRKESPPSRIKATGPRTIAVQSDSLSAGQRSAVEGPTSASSEKASDPTNNSSPKTVDKIEISPNQLFELASQSGKAVLPPVPYIDSTPNRVSAPPPGFSQPAVSSESSISSKTPDSVQPATGDSNILIQKSSLELELEKIKSRGQQSSQQTVNPHMQQLQHQLQMQLLYRGAPLQCDANQLHELQRVQLRRQLQIHQIQQLQQLQQLQVHPQINKQPTQPKTIQSTQQQQLFQTQQQSSSLLKPRIPQQQQLFQTQQQSSSSLTPQIPQQQQLYQTQQQQPSQSLATQNSQQTQQPQQQQQTSHSHTAQSLLQHQQMLKTQQQNPMLSPSVNNSQNNQQLFQTQQQVRPVQQQPQLQPDEQQHSILRNLVPQSSSEQEQQPSQSSRYVNHQSLNLDHHQAQQPQLFASNTEQIFKKSPSYKLEGAPLQQSSLLPQSPQHTVQENQQYLQFNMLQQQLLAKSQSQEQVPYVPINGNSLTTSLTRLPPGSSVQGHQGTNWNAYAPSPPPGLAVGQYTLPQQGTSILHSLLQKPQSTSPFQKINQASSGNGSTTTAVGELEEGDPLREVLQNSSLPSSFLGPISQSVLHSAASSSYYSSSSAAAAAASQMQKLFPSSATQMDAVPHDN